MTKFEDIVEHIESLPPLSPVAFKLKELFRDGVENVNVLKLIRTIEADATLTANVLKFVNAPKYGFSKKISSVSQAVTLLGIEIIYGLVIDYAIHQKLQADISAYGITNIQFNDICHLQSSLLMQWFSKVDLRDALFLTPLALIMEVGKLIIAKEVKRKSFALKFRRGLGEAKDIQQYEYELFGTTSYYVSAILFEHWNIDDIFVEILKNLDFETKDKNHRIEYYCDILNVVRSAVNVKGILTEKSIKEAAYNVEMMGLSSATFLHVANRIKRSYEASKGLA